MMENPRSQMENSLTASGCPSSRVPDVKPTSLELLRATPGLKHLTRLIVRAALSDAPVLIVGESGTGKELVANAIHEQSVRQKKPFVCLNLAAIPTELAEAAMFGHEKGAFTGASFSSPGYCRKAHGGTLFLDECGEADLSLQAKLLRFLQNREIQPVGALSAIAVDVRIVSATNCNLSRAVQSKRFREDLFYRLNVIQISIPPLRERPDDILFLIDYFLNEFNTKYHRSCTLSDPLRDCFRSAVWPGNVRQLRSVIENLVVLSEFEQIEIHDVSLDLLTQIGTQDFLSRVLTDTESVPELDRLTKDVVKRVMRQSSNNVAAAAKRLGISRSTLYRWLRKYREQPSSSLIS